MKLTPNSFFEGEFDKIDLNLFLSSKGLCDSNKPELFQEALNSLGYNTYGGYGENRHDIFKGSYLSETNRFYHLGIDINVPKNTPVKCPFDCQIVNILIDDDKDIGWGGRIILRQYKENTNPYLVLAHLNPESLKNLYTTNIIKRGEYLGNIGSWPDNGNTFCHLHIQCIKHKNFDDFDGYGTKEDLKDNPNPFEINW